MKGWEKEYTYQTDRKKKKKSWDSNTYYIRQNRLHNKGHKKRHRRTLHNTYWKKNINIVNIYTPNIGAPKYSTQIYKENLGGLQEIYRQQQTYTREF